ncbi:hypothetical protein SLEP1_g17863 [Rubroshorea leprosula]|uniref:Uncharacterized protein n=1 Tax=Rubroshorea leprosula TaxID=152421 RepID=A0AAV5J166_9ROSI|nr:hypothetical protein SLEP1_g17863 [Rubroshorea leprosula]
MKLKVQLQLYDSSTLKGWTRKREPEISEEFVVPA